MWKVILALTSKGHVSSALLKTRIFILIMRKASAALYCAQERLVAQSRYDRKPNSMVFLLLTVVFLALQVYYELDDERERTQANDVAICRVEQLCPFPYNIVQRELNRYPSKRHFLLLSTFCLCMSFAKYACGCTLM